MDLFYACITIAIGNGRTTKFWHSPWLGGIKPKDIAPSILEISKLKIFLVHKALQHDFWVANLNLTWGISVTHINEFYPLWGKLQEVQLNEYNGDIISWMLTMTVFIARLRPT
jgi:hypothetical protein